MIEKINSIKKILDKMVGEKDLKSEEVLKVSMELDTLIVEYYKGIIGDKKHKGKLVKR